MAVHKAVLAKGRPAKRRSGGPLIIFMFFLAALAASALPFCIVFAAGMLPTLVAATVDRHPRRYLAMAVGATNLAGMVVPVLALYRFDVSIAGAQHVLLAGQNWLIMYGAAGMGWVINYAMPSVGRFIIDRRADGAERELQRQVDKLVEEWGREVCVPPPRR